MAQGSAGSGARYTWLDTSAAPGLRYSYWLEAVELGRAGRREYGPAQVAQPLYLPLVLR